MNKVAPIYFGKYSSIASFFRQLNLWGVSACQAYCVWRHAYFRRDAPECIKLMKRCPVKKNMLLAKQDKSRTTPKPPVVIVAKPQATATGNTGKKRVKRVSAKAPKNPKKNPTGAESSVIAARDLTNTNSNSPNYQSIRAIELAEPLLGERAEPLLGEQFHFGIPLWQNFEYYMLFSDKLMGLSELNSSAVDTGVDLATVFRCE